MNKRQKEVIQSQLTEEQKVIRQLEQHYRLALDDVEMVIRLLQSDDQTTSKIRRIAYQQKLKTQLEAILERMRLVEYRTLQEYLTGCYTSGYVGTMYDIHGQGVPVIAPINQDAAAKAIQLDTQLSTRKVHKSANGEMMALYESLGIDTDRLKKTIRSEITRGIASGMTYDMMAMNIARVSKAPKDRAKTIARTEGHRIMQQSAEDARLEAKKQGADVVRQWDATLDGETRSAHRELDGQIVELDEYFHYGTKKAKYPGGFGDPALDCNCRCVALTRARWSMDEKELDTLKKRAEAFGLDKTESFKDFDKKYLKAAQTVEKSGEKAYNSIEEMLQKSSDARKDFKFISDERFNQLTIAARKQGAIIMRGTPEVEAHLDAMGASASTLGDVLFFKKDVCMCEVLEETYHFTQNLQGMNDDKNEPLRTILNEIDAKSYVIMNAERYRVPRNEVDLMERQLASYQRQLTEYMKGGE